MDQWYDAKGFHSGKELEFVHATEKHRLHERTNDNGGKAGKSFPSPMVITSTVFLHKTMHKHTWLSSDNMI